MEPLFSVLVKSVLRQQTRGCYDHEIRKCRNSKLKNQHHHLTRSGKIFCTKQRRGWPFFLHTRPDSHCPSTWVKTDISQGYKSSVNLPEFFFFDEYQLTFSSLLIKVKVQTGILGWKNNNQAFTGHINFVTAQSRSEDACSASVLVTFSLNIGSTALHYWSLISQALDFSVLLRLASLCL